MAREGSLDLLSLVHSFINVYDLDWFLCRYCDILLSINKFTSSYFLATSLYLFSLIYFQVFFLNKRRNLIIHLI